ncbi:carbohydrate ABC transporter permease [Paenibacillus sp. GCM10023248]|uniref:carbohydrate ABC transporter permease n=1 Tax=unclassified Paenibacillus TaxID=185978 RepID=UPI00237838EF|nr:sugar ABC transporter permease [Paenibacillus sp. MAHUQ-63]MDD9269437.1 sugar ABC transporter permease [Paenibacillus sp. MAHUQ-63]
MAERAHIRSSGSARGLWYRIWKFRMAYLFLVPTLLLLGSIKYMPFFTAIVESMFDWNGVNVNEFVGLANYRELLTDPKIAVAFANVFKISFFTVAVNLTLPMLVAVLVFRIRNVKLQNFLKVGFIVPLVVPMMVLILLWRWLYAGDFGLINQLLDVAGLGSLKHSWLGDPATALWAILFVGFPWVAGLPFLLYLAGLQSISEELFEVSQMEGVGPFRRFFAIELPLLGSQIKLVLLYGLIHAFQVFEAPYVLTNGGPGITTITPALHIYDQAFNYGRFGYASTIGVAMFAVLIVLTLIIQTYFKTPDKLD